MTRFQKDALREVQELPGVVAVSFTTGGKHDRITVTSSRGVRMFPISKSPSDCHAIDQVVRLVRRAVG